MTDLVELLVEPWTYPFMARALVAMLVASVVCAVLSCWLVLIGWSLMGDAISHSVLPGVVIAHALGAPYALGATVFGGLAAGLIWVVRSRGRIREDAAIGVVFTTLFALGLALVSVVPAGVDLGHIVFGSLLGVGRSDLVQVAVVGGLVLVVLVSKRRDLTLFAFDPAHAHAIGLSPSRLAALLLAMLTLASVVALRTVGVVLVVAMLVIPGVTASLLTERFGRMLVIAPVLSVVCGFVGLLASYHLDVASGPMVVLTQGILFAIVYATTSLRDRATNGSAKQH